MPHASISSRGRPVGYVRIDSSDETKSILKNALNAVIQVEALDVKNNAAAAEKAATLANDVHSNLLKATSSGEERSDLNQSVANCLTLIGNHARIDSAVRQFATNHGNVGAHGLGSDIPRSEVSGAYIGGQNILADA